ncbi:hypothetical protein O6H91_13G060200 [Diphasiastrum complanatum]|uniref:Uncharacterized protein n=1 Tax=Diphasiastrum complanatum TaxID=34168 RepID=A0ACC2BV93_DIPCM|nr:hypothetical protein O6H91_13G060200 [Diphasiastrum complanatum]
MLLAVPVLSMGGNSSKRAMALTKAQELVAHNPLVVFSKTYCPYCTRVNKLFASVGARPKVIELDIEGDGSELQAALAEWTGQQTVPNVFIGGKHIGGCDDTVATHNKGKLIPLLKDAGALA